MKSITFLFLILYLFAYKNVFPQAGVVDSTFGTNGSATCFPDGSALSVEIQNDGRIVAGCYASGALFGFARFNTDGSFDNSFGNNGITSFPLGVGYDLLYDITLQTDGKILASGSCIDSSGFWSFCLARLNTDGSLDNSFTDNGFVFTSFDQGIASGGWGVTVQPDGKIVQVGDAQANGSQYFAVVRFNSDGTLDNTFGTGGKVLTDVGIVFRVATCVEIQPDGKILAGGYSGFGSAFKETFVLVRYNSDGSLDNTFSNDGKVITYFGDSVSNNEYSAGYDIALQPDGKILMTGESYILGVDSSAKIPILRYNTDGSLDSSFGTGGKVQAYFYPDHYFRARTMTLQQDQKIIIGGTSGPDSTSIHSFLLSRFNTNGSVDTTFGENGIVITSVDNSDSGGGSVAMQFDGKIVMSGGSSLQGGIVLRYLSGLNVGVLDLSIKKSSILIYPNPIQTEAVLQYTLITDENISIALYDMQGRFVQSFITNQKRSKGEHEEVLHFNKFLSQGNYILRIGNGENSQAIKVIVQ